MQTNGKQRNREERKAYREAQRLRQVRRQRGLFFASMLFFLMLSVSVWSKSVKSNANDGFKYYKSVVIEDGDTLWTLADSYIDYLHYESKDNYIAEIKSINHLKENCHIRAGQLLIIPYYSNDYVK